jgi:branched-subunit amino acid aminotransferase/4-amino-4-deoxychorismate lyase
MKAEARRGLPRSIWVDGELVDADTAVLRADDSAFSSGRGCYTTGRFEGGRVRFGERVIRRLGRDAHTLGLGKVDEALCLKGMVALGKAHFGDGEGVVRLQASRDGSGSLRLIGVARAVGPEPALWRAISPPFPHEGPAPYAGAKVTNHLLFAMAREEAVRAGVDEATLFDGEGFLIEGARSNFVVALGDGSLTTPNLRRGGVEGVAREILLETLPELEEADLHRRNLEEVRELIAVNAVRGACPVVELDGKPVGDGKPGPGVLRLREALASAQ